MTDANIRLYDIYNGIIVNKIQNNYYEVMYMDYTKRQLNTIEKLFRKHIHSSREEKVEIKEIMKKYAFNNPGEVYRLLKSTKIQEKEKTRDFV